MNVFAASSPSAIGRGARCLVVDDFEAMRKVTINQLRQMGVERIESARNGAEALRLLKNQRFDVVLSDWNMPVMTGVELLQAMRADERLFAIPFVLITAEAERSRVQEAISMGVTSLLLKPYSPKQLAQRLEKALQWKPRAPGDFAGEGLPAQNAHAPATQDTASTPSAEEQEAPRPTILIVDDTPDNLLLLSQLFKGEYRIRLAQTGAKAMEVVTSDDPPDLVLLDIMMPGMDGFEVARMMREHPTSQSIPIIFVTAMASADARIRGLDLGAVDFITKPIDPETLKPRVRNFMRYVQLRKDLQAEFDSMVEAAQLREDVERITRHDIKAPLAGALGLVQALIEDDSVGRRQVEQLRLMEESVMQVLNMINLSSELYKIESGRFVLRAQPVLIGELLRRIAEMNRVTFAEKDLSIAVDTDVAVGAEPPVALADSTLCYSIFQNLLRNACEAAPHGSRVSVQLQDQNPLRIIISNTGAVPIAIRDRFFDKFVTAGKQGGTGLGTYSAKLLTEAQHGSVGLEVFDDTNTTRVVVELPRR
ncbi:two-component system sensor histidine kinase/response regulator [Acidovorax sp. Root275]|uniref:ATP-binding response regulator n=1 Tax=Acidovorax sp. Root275 TaxID=1736508 RepID=UPI00070F900E|nr:response regulator [Acidovorax sp. Root275]KRD46658.1 two-component system sensor histidine kinase/response regulator [Acidovorax sp. Root275]